MRRTLLFGILLATAASAQHAGSAAWLDSELDDLVAIYREFHRNPEVSFREIETSKRLAHALEEVADSVTRNVGGLGVVALIENGAGPTLMLRADLDALPIGERTGLEYASKLRVEHEDGRVEGVMHACGHDVHMTTLIGAARWLAAHRDRWAGRVMLIGQPAEERGAGALAMLEDGLFERFPKPDFALALHVSSDLPADTIGWRAGPLMASVDSVDITLLGRGGHGAMPHLTVDPVVQAAELVMSLQAIVAREISPQEPAVVTVGSIHADTKHNIISDRCDLQLTVRAVSPETRLELREAIERRVRAVAAGAGAPEPRIEFSEGVIPLVNDEALTHRVVDLIAAELGEDRVVPVEPVTTGEDFARYGEAGVPISMLRLGTVSRERIATHTARGEPLPGLHSAYFWPDAAEAIHTGVRALAAAAIGLCPK